MESPNSPRWRKVKNKVKSMLKDEMDRECIKYVTEVHTKVG
jgi:hypothetical protein